MILQCIKLRYYYKGPRHALRPKQTPKFIVFVYKWTIGSEHEKKSRTQICEFDVYMYIVFWILFSSVRRYITKNN